MRKKRKLLLLAAAVLLMTGGAAATAMAAGAEEGGPGADLIEKKINEHKNSGDVFSVKDMEAAKSSSKLVLVVGQGGANVHVSYYEKDGQDVWNEIFETSGVYGRNGGTYEKKEGDGKTPYGTFGINKAFGILGDPGCIMPYEKLKDNDYWVDDSASSHYNRMVNTDLVKKDWNSAEHLIQVAPYYNYVLSLDYNEDAVPGKGSAIFLHCTAEGYTGSSGCICIEEEYMKTVIRQADETMKIVIVPDKEALKNQ